MLDHRVKLVSLGVKISKSRGGCCGGNHSTTAYLLPMRLDVDIIPFLLEFGNPALSFEKTSLLKIDKKHFAITGIRKINQIRFVSKDKKGLEQIDNFEKILIYYIESTIKG